MRDEENYPELLDLRTHLTVALLAASQLKRKGVYTEDLARLQCYLDNSLLQIQGDIAELESLVQRLHNAQHLSVVRSRRFPPRWVGMGLVFLAAKVRRGFLPQSSLSLPDSVSAR